MSQYVDSLGLSTKESASCMSRSHMGYMARLWRGIGSRMDSTKCMRQSSDNSTRPREAGKLIVVIEQLGNKRFRIT